MMTFIVAHRWCRFGGNLSGPEPSLASLHGMLAELASLLAAKTAAPVAMQIESWRRPEGIVSSGDNDFLAQIRLDVSTDGMMTRSIQSWYQWRHPRWFWSNKPFPEKFALSFVSPLPGNGEAGTHR